MQTEIRNAVVRLPGLCGEWGARQRAGDRRKQLRNYGERIEKLEKYLNKSMRLVPVQILAESGTIKDSKVDVEKRHANYMLFADSIARGWFDRNGRSQVLFLSKDAPPMRVTSHNYTFKNRHTDNFISISKLLDDQVHDEGFIIETYLSKCWVPLELARKWCDTNGMAIHTSWRPLTPAPAPQARANKASQKRGRRPKYEADTVKKLIFELMDYHGDFDPNDPDWDCQARLEEAVKEKLDSPAVESTIRSWLATPLQEWRVQKAGN